MVFVLNTHLPFKDVGSLTRYDETAVTTDWQKKLTPKQFYIMRKKGTEVPFTGIYLNNRDPGMYHCVYCNAPLFRSEKKYNSGTGWPSFSEVFGACGTDECNANILRHPDTSLGSTSTEVICKQCDVGHVFDDGPRPSGQKVLYQQCFVNVRTAVLGQTKGPSSPVSCLLTVANARCPRGSEPNR
ncbi:unnamed protein product [Eretmochelys imbricata]